MIIRFPENFNVLSILFGMCLVSFSCLFVVVFTYLLLQGCICSRQGRELALSYHYAALGFGELVHISIMPYPTQLLQAQLSTLG